ncbi:hypothetical protein JIR001_14990 [Polycladomyces abyssicola]|uniref:Uncharacterized protein n=1 Tax=Polycladomyces abyssicola TaxID=1125966 RepID=A0A8D5UGE5_9BACL|nr:hypothetical protein [Polycladomyces abyssicola]BCU81713.1 hypothetical protein JIR001_14960 [Polycladomyces abyssicola]BCU81716.1 hypothetical protein JIR001_14990 [Polycladomyces abyssicola]
MPRFQYVPPRQLSQEHVGKPMKLILKNGKVMYGVIKEIKKDGIVFKPIKTQVSKSQFFFPFFPFFFFFPFLII